MNTLPPSPIHLKLRKSLIFKITGDPVPLARPRFSKRHVWDAQKEQKLVAGITLSNQLGSQGKFNPPIRADILFLFALPRTKRNMRVGQHHIQRPDLDNLIKYVLDVANSVLYTDDKFIAELHVIKRYGETAETILILTEIEENGDVQQKDGEVEANRTLCAKTRR